MSTTPRQRVSTGTRWERQVGYSRATRVGQQVFVAGTTATTRAGGFVGEGDPYAQTRQVLDNVGWALGELGATFADVVRYRAYLTRLDDWPEVGRALAEAFAEVRPVSTLVGVAWLVDPRMLVEIDFDAVVGSATPLDA